METIKEKGQKSGRYSLKKVDEVFTKFEFVFEDFLNRVRLSGDKLTGAPVLDRMSEEEKEALF